MKTFRTLAAEEIECRISQISEKCVNLLLYKTARTDADLLDETFGADRWQNDFRLVDGVLYGGIGIDFKDNGVYVWKWDAGTESNTEAEKGRASDAFKRAGFKHGIGRELYTAPRIVIFDAPIKKNDKGRWVCYENYSVKEIGYDDNEHINKLTIVDESGKVVYSFPNNSKKKTVESKPRAPEVICDDCGNAIHETVNKQGETWAVEQIVAYSTRRFGKKLCTACQKLAFAAEEKK